MKRKKQNKTRNSNKNRRAEQVKVEYEKGSPGISGVYGGKDRF